MPQIVTELELSQLLKVPREVVRSLARGRRIPVINLGRKTRRYDLHAVLSALGASSTAAQVTALAGQSSPALAAAV